MPAIRRPAVAGLIGACLLLGIVGLYRAISEFGHAGFIAFLEVLFGPVILMAAAIFMGPHYNNGLLSGLLPSESALKLLAYGMVIGGAVGAAFTGLFGVVWLITP